MTKRIEPESTPICWACRQGAMNAGVEGHEQARLAALSTLVEVSLGHSLQLCRTCDEILTVNIKRRSDEQQ